MWKVKSVLFKRGIIQELSLLEKKRRGKEINLPGREEKPLTGSLSQMLLAKES